MKENELIYSGNKEAYEALKKKYSHFRFLGDLQMTDNANEFYYALAMDAAGISAVLREFGDGCSIRHGYDENGSGFFLVSNQEKKKIVKSSYYMEIIGGCWSGYVLARLYFGGLRLENYLNELKGALTEMGFSFEMEIRGLYVPFYFRGQSEYNRLISTYVSDIFDDVRFYEETPELAPNFLKVLKEMTEYLSVRSYDCMSYEKFFFQYHGEGWAARSWYNGMEQTEFEGIEGWGVRPSVEEDVFDSILKQFSPDEKIFDSAKRVFTITKQRNDEDGGAV